ncbi:hypothetical protein OQA88_7057 [Cercophora sp. LCS_1]
MADFNPFTTTATDLKALLEAGKTSSVQIVTQYLSQIDRHDPSLHALISVAPRDSVLRIAASLDEERAEGKLRGQLHGVPIVLKVRNTLVQRVHLLMNQDVFITASDLGMGTTAGSRALVGAKASKNAAIVQKLIDAGMIILGKTNLTEFAGMKAGNVMPGWSAVGGQTISPYVGPIVEGETLLGHSEVRTETIGSIVTPASRAALYALKPTVGVQDTEGMYALTDFFDSPGPMAKSAADVTALTEVLLGGKYDVNSSWQGLSVGFVDPGVWKMAEAMCRQFEGTAEQMRDDYISAIAMIKEAGASVTDPVDVVDLAALAVDGQDAIMPIAFWDFNNICIPRFLGGFDQAPVQTLQDIVDFNQANHSKCLPPPYPEQGDLIKALDAKSPEEDVTVLKQKLRSTGKRILDAVLSRYNINMVAAPSDSPLCIHAAAAGYPIATVPLGQLRYNNRPFGLCLVAKQGDEGSLLRFMAAWEAMVGPRPVPGL